MSDPDGPKRREPAPAEPADHELSPEAYEATVPTRLTGFRGTNPTALALAGGIAFAIVLVSLLTFFHRAGAPPPAARVATGPDQPAGPGIGAAGGLQTPFIPEVTPAPSEATPTQEPLIRLPIPPTAQPQVQAAQAAPPAPEVYQPAERPAPAATPEAASGAGGRMQIDQPKFGGATSQDAQAAADVGDRAGYTPVYRNGRLVSVVPAVDASPVAAATPSAASTGSAGPSGQFVSDDRNTSLGSANSGLLEARRFARENQNDNGYARQLAERQLDTGSVINCRLMSKIETDLPGVVLAQVTEPVYDSATHSIVVIPAGTRVFGGYDEETVSTSTRALLVFNRLIFPDGEEFDIGGQGGYGADGTAGFGGDIDHHRGTLYTSAVLLTVLAGAESELTPQSASGLLGGSSITSQVQSAAGAELSQLANKVLNNAIDRPATIIIRPPYAFQIIVKRDLPLEKYAVQHP